MPKYLLQASYTAEGVPGIRKEGGSRRRAAAEELIKSAGGTLEAFYFGFGETDAYVIADLPDNASCLAALLAVGGSGIVEIKTTVLLTVEEMDQAAKRAVSYRPPGR
jgi:uncharacterized protein with GYD domain